MKTARHDGDGDPAPETTRGARPRLDSLMFERGLADSRARARDAILRGHVRVDGVVVGKPGATVSADAAVVVDDPAGPYVSRAALKLIAGLDAFDIAVEGRTCLDVGASTGGFTDVLLRRGAAHVVSIDVGHGQLHARIAADARVTAIEGLNSRDLTREHLGEQMFDRLVCDVSFISLKLALPRALDLAEAGCEAVLLVKPQFEAGRQAIGKGGILRDPELASRVADDLFSWLGTMPGWRATGLVPSPIEGGDGNREFLLAGVKTRC